MTSPFYPGGGRSRFERSNLPGSALVLLALLHRCADERPVLGPAPVVVLDASIPQELPEHEPRVGGPLPDPAVGDDLMVGADAGSVVQLLELVGRLERPVVVSGLGPRDVGRTRDVA